MSLFFFQTSQQKEVRGMKKRTHCGLGVLSKLFCVAYFYSNYSKTTSILTKPIVTTCDHSSHLLQEWSPFQYFQNESIYDNILICRRRRGQHGNQRRPMRRQCPRNLESHMGWSNSLIIESHQLVTLLIFGQNICSQIALILTILYLLLS